MDSTIKSNLSVGLPLDLLCYQKDALKVERRTQIDGKDPYFNSLRERWASSCARCSTSCRIRGIGLSSARAGV